MIITKEFLKNHNACKEGIRFAENNGLLGIELDDYIIEGDYNGYFDWLLSTVYEEKHWYDKQRRCVSKQDKRGFKALYEYDDYGNCSYEKLFNGIEAFYTHDKNGVLLKAKNSIGLQTNYKYNENGHCIYKKDRHGGGTRETWYTCDANGNVLHEIDSYDDEERYQYDSRGNCIYHLDSYGYEVFRDFHHDENGVLTHIVENGEEELRIYKR